jgi:hypothetical protein
MYLVICHMTPLPFLYLEARFKNYILLNVLITTVIKYLLFADNYVGDIQFIKDVIVLHISAIPDSTNTWDIC